VAKILKYVQIRRYFIARVAQLVERWTFNPTVQGSSPCSGVYFANFHFVLWFNLEWMSRQRCVTDEHF
jgi:hypothetical protein